MLGGLKAPYPMEVLKISPEDSIVCEIGVDGEAMEAGEPRLLRLLNPAGEVKLCSDVDPRLLKMKYRSSLVICKIILEYLVNSYYFFEFR